MNKRKSVANIYLVKLKKNDIIQSLWIYQTFPRLTTYLFGITTFAKFSVIELDVKRSLLVLVKPVWNIVYRPA